MCYIFKVCSIFRFDALKCALTVSRKPILVAYLQALLVFFAFAHLRFVSIRLTCVGFCVMIKRCLHRYACGLLFLLLFYHMCNES